MLAIDATMLTCLHDVGRVSIHIHGNGISVLTLVS